jgi:hypothetical protein
MDKEISLVIAIKPELEHKDNQMFKDLTEAYVQHGGKPKVIGVCKINFAILGKDRLRYKVQYPDGSIDYLNMEIFDTFFEFVPEVN